MSTPTLNPAIIGQVEKHHTAVLARALSGTTLDEKQWITLNQALTGPIERSAHIARVATMTQWDPTAVAAAVTALLTAGLLRELPGDRLEATEAGATLVGRIRTETGAIVTRAYEAVSAEDRAVAARVLTIVKERLAVELAD
ncbi:hypothetical protein [Nocardia pseudobrasiliensis]|uniref:DNA-binding MarR family transcriptional regulator n=1 Tax=Nocardia pseudobrasiliensis TaxID=45979 RepID=A0A370I5E2_9NOCA|nr:hypothetical protein [Nocardia pseudobrasiliensis]RDI65925.1 hypothetical protein DFR76_105244 [Nocardia pseudobrasiliensis]